MDEMENELEKRSILPINRLDAWIVTVVDCFSRWKICRVHRERKYADTFVKIMKLSVEQIFGQIRVLLERWEPKKLMV